jgi:hypothetical protein
VENSIHVSIGTDHDARIVDSECGRGLGARRIDGYKSSGMLAEKPVISSPIRVGIVSDGIAFIVQRANKRIR